jgi:pimeloyl-ACP methyl ester carboxylesterase
VHSIFRAAAPHAAMMRMVWLPGAYQAASDFLEAGFPEAVLNRHAALDLEFVDLGMRHMGDRSVLRRLRSEVIVPARNGGLSVWLAGISLGGLIALDYAATYPQDLDGLCLFAPYLGNRMLTAEINAAPGLEAWEPGELAEADEERRIWRHIKEYGAGSAPLYLGFGADDRFSAAHQLLASKLPADAVDIIEGGHDWPTWKRLWENFLQARFA